MTHCRTETLRELVESSLADPGNLELANRIQQNYESSIAPESTTRCDLNDEKFLYSHWYSLVVDRLASELKGALPNERRLQILEALSSLHYFVRDEDLHWWHAFSRSDDLGTRGREIAERLALDSALPPKVVIRPYEKMKDFRAVSTDSWPRSYINFPYLRDPNGNVVYRGITWLSGDHIAADLAKPGEGTIDAIGEDTPVYTHSGLYIDLWSEKHGQFVPSVLEIHKYGMRLVPLAAFVSPKVIYHARVLRHPNMDEQIKERDIRLELSSAIRNMPAIAYDWQGRDPIDDFSKRSPAEYTCSAVCVTLLEIAGFPHVITRTRVVPKAATNLGRVNQKGVSEFNSTSALTHGSGLVTAGTIDNQRFADNFARYAMVGHSSVPGSAGHALATMELNPKKFPISFSKYVVEIHAGRTRLIGGMLQKAAGFATGTFPESGSPELISYWLISNELLRESSQQFRNSSLLRTAEAQEKPLIASDWLRRSEVTDLVRKLNTACGILTWYS
ncbi:hypothetical protein SH449x_003852 [Pirellulaceae bacterium SH449]